jgi:hypothetical protein
VAFGRASVGGSVAGMARVVISGDTREIHAGGNRERNLESFDSNFANEELRQHMANTIARHNRRGWRLDKPSLEQPNDSIIALCMALEALENQPEPVEVIGWL